MSLIRAVFLVLVSFCVSVVFATAQEADITSTPRAESMPAVPGPGFAWVPKAGDEIAFKVIRNGSAFGTHKISFSGDADGELKVRSQVALKAGLGPITVFRYALDTTETWLNGVLVGLRGSGNNDGKKMRVSAEANADMLSIEGSEYTGVVALGIIPSSHWNISQVQGTRMVSTEDGEIIPTRSQKVDREALTIAGQRVEADRYLLDAAIDLDLWYDDQARLVKLAFRTKGQLIEYELQKLY